MANALEHPDSSTSPSDDDYFESLPANYQTPDTDDCEEPARDPRTQDFCDREYELKVRDHQHAIKKVYPHVIAKSGATKAERESQFTDFLAALVQRRGEDFYDKEVRRIAERHVRRQATPKQAYAILKKQFERLRAERIAASDESGDSSV
jgi:hypothetical protein